MMYDRSLTEYVDILRDMMMAAAAGATDYGIMRTIHIIMFRHLS